MFRNKFNHFIFRFNIGNQGTIIFDFKKSFWKLYIAVFQINRKVDSSYGTKVKDQKKEKAKAEKSISKIRTWVINEKKVTINANSIEN